MICLTTVYIMMLKFHCTIPDLEKLLSKFVCFLEAFNIFKLIYIVFFEIASNGIFSQV